MSTNVSDMRAKVTAKLSLNVALDRLEKTMYMLGIGTFLLAYIIYRQIKWYFSPYRCIPAPYEYPIVSHYPYFLAGNTDVLNLLKGWAKRFKKHGMFRFRSLFSLSDYTICLLNPGTMKYILSRPEIFERPVFFKKYFPLTGDGLLTSTGESHRWQKKMLSTMFSMPQTKCYISTFNKHCDVFIKLWKSITDEGNGSANIDVKFYSNNLSFDIICEAAFGYHFDSQTSLKPSSITKGFRDTIDGVLNNKSMILLRIFPFLKYAPFGPAQALKDVQKSAESFMEMVFQNRLEKTRLGTLSDSEKNDLLYMLMNSVDEKTNQKFSEQLVKDNAYTFIVAGHETTASTVPGMLYHLAKHPDYQEKCREEIRSVLNGNQDFTFEDLNRLPFTTAVLKECLRLFATIANAGRVCTRDVVVEGHHFPKGNHFMMPYFLVNENEDDFTDASQFKPERYLSEDPDKKLGTSFTFGYGPYGCIGKHFSMQELKVILVRLLQNFRFTIDPECEDFYRRIKVTIVFKPALKIRVHTL